MKPGNPELDPLPAQSPPRSVLARLPAFHREQAGLAASLAEAAEDLLETFEAGMSQLAERLCESARGVGGVKSRAGTVQAAREWLAERHGSSPRIGCGLVAEAAAAGSLELRPAKRPAALIAWDREVLPPGKREGLALPAELIPPGVQVQIAVLKLPAAGWPRAGERIAGEIVWDGERTGSVGGQP